MNELVSLVQICPLRMLTYVVVGAVYGLPGFILCDFSCGLGSRKRTHFRHNRHSGRLGGSTIRVSALSTRLHRPSPFI